MEISAFTIVGTPGANEGRADEVATALADEVATDGRADEVATALMASGGTADEVTAAGTADEVTCGHMGLTTHFFGFSRAKKGRSNTCPKLSKGCPTCLGTEIQ